MSHSNAHVREAVLVYRDGDGGEQRLDVGSSAWYAWLIDDTTQHFTFEQHDHMFSAAKERKQRGGWYWVAYWRVHGKRHKAYLGKPADLSVDRLEAVATQLLARAAQTAAPAPPHPVTPAAPPGALLATKFYAPRVRPHTVARPRLTACLNRTRAAKLTLICAPAGFGKTTLLSQWIAAPHAEASGCNIAWLALDKADNDPVRFWCYVISALEQHAPGIGAPALAVLQAARGFPAALVLTTLVNALNDAASDIILILDDYHVIDAPVVHQSLNFLLDHLPPCLHLVLATRSDPPLPLARLRARGELNELRATDLRFTTEETSIFLRTARDLSLSADAVAALETRTEGWIAGLQLAALALRDHADPAGFVATFTGSNRFVMDYLASEVLDQLPPHIHAFVLQTSILDRMCGPLCDALLSAPAAAPGDGQAVLEDLERANLFVIPLDDTRHWYRYHHLFAEVARGRLQASGGNAAVDALHRRASSWYERQGLIVEAAQHALAAHDWERAASIVEQHGLAIAIGGLVRTVLDWLSVIPDQHIRVRPLLCICHAIVLLFTNQLGAAEARLRDAEGCVTSVTPPELARAVLGQVALARANIVRATGDLATSVALSQQALELLPETMTIARAGVILNNARAYQLTGDVAPAAEQQARAAITPTRTVGNLIATLNGFTNLARLQVLQGRLRAAAATYEEAIETAPGDLGIFSNSPAYSFGLADLMRQWNDLEAAERYLTQGMDLMRGGLIVEADTVTLGYVTLARVLWARDDLAGAHAALDEFEQRARQRAFFPQLLTGAAALRARLLLVQGQLDAALHWARASGLHPDDALSYPREHEYLTWARIQIAQRRVHPADVPLEDTLRLLDRLLVAAEAGSRMDSVIEMCIVQALALDAQDQREAALSALRSALILAAPEGYVRVFVDEGAPLAELLAHSADGKAPTDLLLPYIARLLDAGSNVGTVGGWPGEHIRLRARHVRHPAARPLVEPLTTRECEVLRLLEAGASNRAIAEQLVITVGTVKRHLNNLFGKLGVQSRTQAIHVARALDLL